MIGLVPAVTVDKIKAVGNTASEGAKMALMSFREREVAWTRSSSTSSSPGSKTSTTDSSATSGSPRWLAAQEDVVEDDEIVAEEATG